MRFVEWRYEIYGTYFVLAQAEPHPKFSEAELRG